MSASADLRPIWSTCPSSPFKDFKANFSQTVYKISTIIEEVRHLCVSRHRKIILLVVSVKRRLYLFGSVHQGRGAVLLPPVHLHPLPDQQPEDVVLAARCRQHAQGHAADVLQTEGQSQRYGRQACFRRQPVVPLSTLRRLFCMFCACLTERKPNLPFSF